MQTSTHLSLTTPGVYLQEIPPAPEPEWVTGVPLFLGLTQEQPLAAPPPEPKLLTLWTQFGQYFEQSLPNSFLARAVRGFFENGGRFCYVLPLRVNELAELQAALQAVEVLDRIDLICAPNAVQNPLEVAVEMQAAILEHCDKMGDRFAILDVLSEHDFAAIADQKRRLVGDSGALYAPWLKLEDAPGYIPPCGHIAGVYARNDREAGSHRAPANYLLEAALDLSAVISSADWQDLNPEVGPGVNCIQSFRGRGIRVWGARTLSRNPDWRYVNIRRLKITFLRWVERNLADVAFEPSNAALWGRLERELSIYCESLWEQGALQGSAIEEAFYVKCDAETNPPEVYQAGQVVAEIGLAPSTPAEFIVLSLVHGNRGVTFAQA